MTKFTCLIVDDEPLAVELLEDFVLKAPALELVGKFYDAVSALKYLHEHPVDLVLLDINMPHLTGLELANIIRPETKIIFTTAYSEHALESYERNAVDYLVKPITLERFLRAVGKLDTARPKEKGVPSEGRQSDNFFIKSGKKIVQVDLREVTHIEGMGDYAIFHHQGEKIIVGKTLKELELQLPDYIQRIHLSFFVNINHIKKIEDNHVSIGPVSIPISNKYREEFQTKINKKLL